jgi:hypothetical protein
VKNLIRRQLQKLLSWINPVQTTPSYMVYLGRNIPLNSNTDEKYVSDFEFKKFLSEQPYFDSFTIWDAQGSWRDELEDTCVIEVFDTDFDIIVKFAHHYRQAYYQEAVYIKIIETNAILVDGDFSL